MFNNGLGLKKYVTYNQRKILASQERNVGTNIVNHSGE